MAHTLADFAATCHEILSADPGPRGRELVRKALEEMLKDEEFLARYLPDDMAPREIIYEDPDLGFCILAHAYSGTGTNATRPHDHGPSWAIYGQARGETMMTDWAVVEPAAEGKPGKVRFVRDYALKPGMAHLYNEGDLHSPRQDGPTRLIRLEGTNMEKVRRFAFQAISTAPVEPVS